MCNRVVFVVQKEVKSIWHVVWSLLTEWLFQKIVAAFRGMHVSPAKHSYASVTDGQTDRRTDRQTDGQTDRRWTKLSLCVAMLRRRHRSIATQKLGSVDTVSKISFVIAIKFSRLILSYFLYWQNCNNIHVIKPNGIVYKNNIIQ